MTDAGLLARCLDRRFPGGFAYDVFNRRLEKRRVRGRRVLEHTRTSGAPTHSCARLRETAKPGGPSHLEETAFVYAPGAVLPLAQQRRATSAGAAAEASPDQRAPLEYFVYGPNSLPVALVNDRGEVLAALESTFHGRALGTSATRTRQRFAGQLQDVETGLAYQRFRYFDPDLGAYISPEPLGIEGSLLPYAYAEYRPDEYVDLDGLRVYSAVGGYGGPTGTTPITGTGMSNSKVPRSIPPVEAAMLSPGSVARARVRSARKNCASRAR